MKFRHDSGPGMAAIWIAGLVLGALALPAAAQMPCPGGPGYGQRIVAVRDNLPLCAEDPQPEPEQASRSADPMRETTEDIAEVTRGLTNSMQYMLGLMAEASRLQAGDWTYSAPGQSCSATFISPEGFVRIDGPNGTATRPLLTFYSTRIPEPSAPKVIDIGFENSSPDSGQGAKMAVKGVNWPPGAGKRKGGFISLQLATAPVLIRGLEDRLRFKLSVADKPVFDLTWRGGLEAKARLAECLKLQ